MDTLLGKIGGTRANRPRPSSICAAVALSFLAVSCGRSGNATTATTSPDGGATARIVEIPGLDRNFELRLTDGSGERTIFTSPDEGRPPDGTLYWSPDGRYLLLTGRSFFVRDNAKLPGGLALYLLVDTTTGDVRCNATQSDLPGFTADEVRSLAFQPPIEVAPER